MALSDLLNELKKDTFRMDNDSEKKICNAMVQLFDDPSGDVQGMAVKWYEIFDQTKVVVSIQAALMATHPLDQPGAPHRQNQGGPFAAHHQHPE